MEEWRPVIGFEGQYDVSSHGRVRSVGTIITSRSKLGLVYKKRRKPRILKAPISHSTGYPSITLPCGFANVHGLVAEAFLGPRPRGHVVRHVDGIKANCCASNLEYGTYAENENDKIRHGTKPPSEHHHKAKLTRADVREIRLLGPHDDHATLADHYGIDKTLVGYILSGKIWCQGPAGTPRWLGIPDEQEPVMPIKSRGKMHPEWRTESHRRQH